MMNTGSALAAALNELAALGSGQDREQIAALRDRLDAARLRVLVAGEAKRGKSTLINALLGRAVLPAGVTPLTAVATTVRYGNDPHAEVRFADGHEEKQPMSALPELVTERGNPGNRRRIAAVTVYLDAPLLAGGVELVDTPGTGSVFAWDTAAAHQALESMDAAVFVLTADPPVSAAERDLYAKVSGMSVATFAVLNKADHLDEAGLAEAAEFTSAGAGRSIGRARVRRAAVYPLSARAALNGGDPGFDAFAADFKAYLASSRVRDLRSSAVMQARRIARSLLDEVALTRRAAQLTAGDAADRVARFSERLAEVAVRGRDAVAVVNAESARLLMALNDAAEADGPRLGRDVTGQLEEVLGGELRTAPPAEIERQGRERLVALTLAAADAWRAQRREIIEEGLARTDARLAADLTAALGGAARFRGRAAGPGPGGSGARRPTRRGPPVLLHDRRRGRPDRAAGRSDPPQAPRRAGPPQRPRAPAPRGRRPGGEPDRPGQGRPAVPAVGGVPRPGPFHGAAVRGGHGPDAGRPAGGRGTAGRLGRRGGPQGTRAIRTDSGGPPRAHPARRCEPMGVSAAP